MASSNSSDPDRSRSDYIKKAKRTKQVSCIFNSAGMATLGVLFWLAVTGHFKDNLRDAIFLYLTSAFFMFIGTTFQDKYKDIMKTLDKKNKQK